MSPHPANKLSNVRRRVDRARRFPTNTCPASRHLHTMADALTRRGGYPMLREEPEHCAGSMYAVLEALWKARTRLAQLEPMEAALKRKPRRLTFRSNALLGGRALRVLLRALSDELKKRK